MMISPSRVGQLEDFEFKGTVVMGGEIVYIEYLHYREWMY